MSAAASATPPLALVGPTATGKTVLAVELALRLGGELVNVDSRQVIRRLRVGTAAPTDAELRGVHCHLLELAEPGEPFTAADWLLRAREVLDSLAARGVPAILAGGTGQYLRALREGWEFTGGAPDPATRAGLTARAAHPTGLEELAGELRARDPEGAASVDLANPRRVIRALELLRGGAPSLAEARHQGGGVDVEVVVLDAERRCHAEALEARMDRMFTTGDLLREVEAELDRGTPPGALARCGIGYAEAVAVLEGRSSIDAARGETLRRTRRYVKAQRTWFRHEPATLRLCRGDDGPGATAALAGEVLAALSPEQPGRPPGSRR